MLTDSYRILNSCRRTENLKARSDKKIQNKKDKREKKLMRAGFEGRRDTFIGSES